MKRNLKIVIVIGLTAAAIGGFVAYKMWNKPHADATEMEGIKISAIELYKSFESDEQKANQNYVGKVLEINGIVSEIENTDSISRIVLSVPEGSFGAVRVTLDKRYSSDVKSVKAEQNIVIKGFCSGYLTDVEIKDGVIVK
jgi:uncharacterized protein (DUF1330 family)